MLKLAWGSIKSCTVVRMLAPWSFNKFDLGVDPQQESLLACLSIWRTEKTRLSFIDDTFKNPKIFTVFFSSVVITCFQQTLRLQFSQKNSLPLVLSFESGFIKPSVLYLIRSRTCFCRFPTGCSGKQWSKLVDHRHICKHIHRNSILVYMKR